jgi:MFS family permease
VIVALTVTLVLTGIGIGCAETAENAAVAAFGPQAIRGSAFGLLAAVQAGGNVAASTIAGLLYTLTTRAIAFGHLATSMIIALAAHAWAAAQPPGPEPTTAS